MHGEYGDGGSERATPRVEGSYDRCCRWIPGLEQPLTGLESSGKGERFRFSRILPSAAFLRCASLYSRACTSSVPHGEEDR